MRNWACRSIIKNMPKRRARRKKPFKLKLKKKTIYTIFSLGFFLVGVLFLISIIHTSDSTMVVNNWSKDKFGALAILFPFALFFFGFLFMRLKLYLSQVNVTVGYMLIFLSLLGLTRSGVIGAQIFSILQQIITTPGADLVFIGGLLVGTIVFFDTSIDEIVEMLTNLGDTCHHPSKKIRKSYRTNSSAICSPERQPVYGNTHLRHCCLKLPG